MFLCDACHSLFESDNKINSCPNCHAKQLILFAGDDKKLLVPAVRIATNKEAGAYRQVTAIKNTANDLHQRIVKLKSYDLSDSEYNLSLMILWVYRDYAQALIQYKLKAILTSGSGIFLSERNKRDLLYFCECAKLCFIDCISKERKSTQCNNIVKVAEKIDGESATRVLLHFRQSEDEMLKRKIPNLANIRKVDINGIAKKPSNYFAQLLIDLYNGIF